MEVSLSQLTDAKQKFRKAEAEYYKLMRNKNVVNRYGHVDIVYDSLSDDVNDDIQLSLALRMKNNAQDYYEKLLMAYVEGTI